MSWISLKGLRVPMVRRRMRPQVTELSPYLRFGRSSTPFGVDSGNEMRVSLFLILTASLCGCSDSGSRTEVISLIAIEEVQLVDPDTVAGRSIQVLGTLPAGSSLPVLGCRPRKSDIDVLVLHDGKTAVAWQGKYTLSRRLADLSKDRPAIVTRSCWGLLSGQEHS
jgi:hypothetical protein